MLNRREVRPSSLDRSVGGVLSWVTGKSRKRDDGSPTEEAVSELASWTGLVPRSRHKRQNSRSDEVLRDALSRTGISRRKKRD